MNVPVIKIFNCVAAALTTFSAFAQDSTGRKVPQPGVGNEEVVVVKAYEASIQDAQKIDIQPGIPDIETTPIKPDYSIPQQEFKDIPFEPNPLRPLALGQEKLEPYATSFIKLGMGSQLMPLAQLAYNDNKTRNLHFGFYYDHLSAKGYTIPNQQFSDDNPGAYLRYFPKKFEVGAEFSFRNYRTHFYGVEDSSFSEKEVRQVFRTYDGRVYFKNAQPNDAKIDVLQTLDFNYFHEGYGDAYEYYGAGQTNFSKSFLQYHSALFSINFDVSQLKNDSFTLFRPIITPMLGYGFNNDDWKALGKLGMAIDQGRVIVAADIHLEKRLYQHAIIAYIGYTRGDMKNSLQSLALENNFIQNYASINNSVEGNFSAGFKGTASDFSYNIAFHLLQVSNLPLFINDSADMKRFIVEYAPEAIIYNGHFEAGYKVKEWLRFLLVGDYNSYQFSNNYQPWNLPAFKGTFRISYVWKNKISAYLDLYGVTNTQAWIPDNQSVLLRGTGDLNLGAEYIMNKHISFFANLNNIANIQYQPYYLYPGFGINGMIGAKFSF